MASFAAWGSMAYAEGRRPRVGIPRIVLAARHQYVSLHPILKPDAFELMTVCSLSWVSSRAVGGPTLAPSVPELFCLRIGFVSALIANGPIAAHGRGVPHER